MTSALKTRGFKIASINVASLLLHIEEIRIIMADQRLDLLAVNETRLNSTITDDSIHINGYSIIRNDRNRNGGGVCIYIRTSIDYCLRNELIPLNEFEILSIDIKKPNSKAFNVTAAYRPPNCTAGFFEALEAIIRAIDIESKEHIVLGDLNCNYLSNSSNTPLSQLKQLSTTYQFQQLITEPTRITPNSSTLIDIILSNEPSKILKSGVLHLGISDHSMVYAVRKFSIPTKNTQKHVTTRSFKNFKSDAFREELKSVPWDIINKCNTPDKMVDLWESMFLKIANTHAPMKTRRVRNKKSPWITSELRKLIINRNIIKEQAALTKNISDWNNYKKERNRVNNEIKKAKANYYKTEVEESTGNPKAIWKIINELTNRKCTSNSSITELKVDNNSFKKPAEICEILNDHFTSIGPKLASSLPSGSVQFESYIKPVSTTFNMRHTSASEVLTLISKLSPNKATGLDNISCRLLKEAGPIIAFSLACIINKSIDTGLFPSKWKRAKVFPLYKHSDRTSAQNYRPISVLPAISKICERVIYDQLYCYLNSNGLLSKHQSGFRSLHSTVTALLHLTNDWYLNIDNGLTNLVVFLDLAKAFDTVSHDILLKKLELYGLKGVTLEWFSSYLSDRQQQCVVEECVSKPKLIKCGIPQGSILGPLLFLIYINDLPGCLLHTKVHMYADDTTLYSSSTSTAELYTKVNEDLNRVRDWLLANKLSLNVTKTEYMFLTTNFRLSNLGKDQAIKIGKNQIERVKSTKYLGVYLNENLKWSDHVNQLCSKVNKSIRALKQARDYASLDILNIIYKSLIQPVFDYCDVVWDNLDKGLATKLQKLQNRAARIITFQNYDVRSAQLRKQLNWEDLATRRQRHLSLFMHNIVNNKTPNYLSDLFSNARETNPYKCKLRNTEFNIDFSHAPKTDYGKGAFCYRGGMLWNSLQRDTKASQSKTIFIKNIIQAKSC